MSETVNKVAILSSAVKHALLADVQYYDFHASSAFNRKMKGIITPGFYGGFEPALAGGLNLKITSLQGPGGHGVASVDVNNHQITVQQIEDVTLAIPVNGVTRVMLEANYQYGVKTSQVDDSSDIHAARIFTANISVPLADNHLEICRVTVPADATELTLDMIDSSYRRNKALGITLSSEIDSDADHIGASSHAVKKAVKAARDETEKQIEELVDNAPASLDTLKKIADAINNDPDFFNTLNAVLALKAPLHDPALTGIATVPTPPLSVSNKQIANTEYVQAAVAALVGSSPEALDTLAELADALGNDPNFATTMLNKLAGKQPLHEVLTSLSGLNSAANKLAFFNGPNSMALANLTAVGRVLIGQESVAKVLEYLGLVETVNRAAEALQKDQNGGDIPDKQLFVRNIGAARAFSGGISIGGGGNWTTADFIVWLESQGAFNHPYWMCKGSWAYASNRTITDTGCGNIQLAGAVVEVMGSRGAMTIRITTATTGEGALSAQFTYINHGDGYLPGWRRDFNTKNKPTSEDVGALPKTGGEISGDLDVKGIASTKALYTHKLFTQRSEVPFEFGLANQVSGNHYWDIHTTYPEIDYDYRIAFNHAVNRIDLLHKTGYAGLNVGGFAARSIQIENAGRGEGNSLINHYDSSGKLVMNYGCYMDGFSINFYDVTGAWQSNPLFVGRNGNVSVPGNLSGGAVYEGGIRVYSPNNPQPVSFEGYATQSWVLQNFVQNIDLTAPAEVGFWDGRGYPRGTDGAAMYNFNMVGGSSNVGNFIVRYTRKQVNNTWYVIN